MSIEELADNVFVVEPSSFADVVDDWPPETVKAPPVDSDVEPTTLSGDDDGVVVAVGAVAVNGVLPVTDDAVGFVVTAGEIVAVAVDPFSDCDGNVATATVADAVPTLVADLGLAVAVDVDTVVVVAVAGVADDDAVAVVDFGALVDDADITTVVAGEVVLVLAEAAVVDAIVVVLAPLDPDEPVTFVDGKAVTVVDEVASFSGVDISGTLPDKRRETLRETELRLSS